MDVFDEAVERVAAIDAAREVIERMLPTLATMSPEDADAWSRAIAVEHFADASDQGFRVYEALVAYAQTAREHRV